jgi:hypothetical protein
VACRAGCRVGLLVWLGHGQSHGQGHGSWNKCDGGGGGRGAFFALYIGHQLDSIPFAHSSPHPHSLFTSLPFPPSGLCKRICRLSAGCLASAKLCSVPSQSQAIHRIGSPREPSILLIQWCLVVTSDPPTACLRSFLARSSKALLSVDPPSLRVCSILVSCLPNLHTCLPPPGRLL